VLTISNGIVGPIRAISLAKMGQFCSQNGLKSDLGL